MLRECQTHEIKIHPEYYKARMAGKKDWEYRLDDRGFCTGDTVILKEWDPETKEYTGKQDVGKITYLHNLYEQELEDRYVIFTLK